MFDFNNKKNSLNLGGYIALALTSYVIYYLLVKDNFLHFSMGPLLNWTQNYKQLHILAIALVPIYLAFIIFGASLLSSTMGSALQRWLIGRWQN